MPAGHRPASARPAGLVVRPLTSADTEDIATWQYDGPWHIYDSTPDGQITAASGYQAVADPATGALVGFICLGEEARVPGLLAEPGIVDVGAGMRPDLVGTRVGTEFGAAVLRHVAGLAGQHRLRAVVQSWNERSLRLCTRLGFRAVGTHTCIQDGQEVSYVVLMTGAPAVG
jgi:[ribosomal protein S18]-alanine N-acetyltransferase